MNKLAIVFAVGAAALLGGSAANAADNAVRAKAATDVMQQSTDFSSSGRHYRNYRPYGVIIAHTMATATDTLRGRTMAADMASRITVAAATAMAGRA